MKRNLFRAALAAVVFAATFALLPSCNVDTDNCSLDVRNDSTTDGDVIKNIFVQKSGESGYSLKFSDVSIKKGDSRRYWYEFPEGTYTFQLQIYRENGWNSTDNGKADASDTHLRLLDMGYKNFRKFEENGTVTIIFDGNGCYFAE